MASGITEDVVDTARVRFGYARTGTGPPVVLVPGSGGWRLTFEALAARLSTSHTVYAIDPPGQGATRVTDGSFGYDVDAVTHAIAALLDALGLAEVAVVGHSWGGGFAARLAQLHPDRVTRLALLAPAGLDVPDVWEFRLLRLPIVGELALRLTSTASVRHMVRKSFAHRARVPEHLIADAARALRSGPDAAGLRRDLLATERSVTWAQTERDLRLVRCPTLIVWGERDRYFPARSIQRFTGHLPSADVQLVPGAGHSVHDDRPDEVTPRLVQFLADPPLCPEESPVGRR